MHVPVTDAHPHVRAENEKSSANALDVYGIAERGSVSTLNNSKAHVSCGERGPFLMQILPVQGFKSAIAAAASTRPARMLSAAGPGVPT